MEGNNDHSTIDAGGDEAGDWAIDVGSPSRSIRPRVRRGIICPRVDKKIKDVDPCAYKPQLISFGPYHFRKNPDLENVERVKGGYKRDLLDRFEIQREEAVLSEKIAREAMECYDDDGGDDDARRYYKEQMMNDGCFIVELFLKFNDLFKRGVATDGAEEASNGDQVGYHDLPFKKLTEITNDILLLENQLPFFILETIYDNCKKVAWGGFLYPDSFKDLTVIYFQSFISVYSPPGKDFDHLLHLFHTCLVAEATKTSINWTSWLSRAFSTPPKDYKFKVEAYRTELRNALRTEKSQERRQLIHSATELSICGVKFKRFRKVFSTTVMGNFMNVDFKGGVVKIAALRGPIFRVLRNLIAMEHMAGWKYGSDVAIYGYFISGLVESCEDVELLKREKILVDWREKEVQVVVDKLQSLCTGIDIGKMESRLWDVMLRILAHCEAPENNFNAQMHAFFFNPWETLMVDYFGSPWKALATIGGTIVVGLTIAQTTASFIQLKQH